MHRVEGLGLTLREMGHAGGDHFQAGSFKTCIDLTDYVFGNGVGLDDGKGAFDGHGDSL